MTPSALDSLLGAVSVMKPQGTNLLPLQGVLQIAIIPRAMPWAKSFWAFSPSYTTCECSVFLTKVF